MPATTVETLIYKLEVQDNASKVFRETAKQILSVNKALTALSGAVGGPLGILSSLGKTAISAFTSMAKSAGDFVSDSIKNFANYEDILTHAARTLDLTKEEALALGDALTELSTGALQGGVAAEELARIAGVAGQLGVAKEDVIGFTETVAQMSAAFGISADKAAEGMAIILNVFKLSQEEMTAVGSAIAELGNSTAATAGQIINISQRMGAVAEFMGLSAEQTAAIAATLRDVGVSVNVAGSSMSQILARIMSEHTKFAEVLGINAESLRAALESNDPSQALFMVLEALNGINAIGGKLEATQALKDLGLTGVRTQNSMLLLAGSVNELRENMELANQASAAGTSLQDLYQKSIDTATGRWKAFKEAISTVQKIVGGPLADAFSKFLNEYITPLVEEFGAWLKTSPLFKTLMEETLPDALDYLGERIDLISESFFDFFDALDEDTAITELIGKIKVFGTVGVQKLEQLALQALTFFENMNSTIESLRNAKNVVMAFGAVLRDAFLIPIKLIARLHASIQEINEDISGFVMSAVADTESWSGAVKNLLGNFMQLGKEVVWNSVIPDIIEATRRNIQVTDEMGNSVEYSAKTYRDLQVTADGLFTNLKKYSEVSPFERTSQDVRKVSADADAGAFSFDRMWQNVVKGANASSEAVQWVGHEIDVFIADVKDYTSEIKALAEAGASIINPAMTATGGSIQTAMSAGGFDPESLQQAIRENPLMFSSSFLAQRGPSPALDTSMPALAPQMAMPQSMTLNVDGEEVSAVLTPKINDQNQQITRRASL